MRAGKMVTIAAVAALLLAGCGGGDSGGDSGSSSTDIGGLAGSWGGTIWEDVSTFGTITLSVSSDGSFSGSNTLGGAFAGTATLESGTVYSYLLTNNLRGGFITDTSATYMAWVDETLTGGIMQKNAAGPPSSTALSDMGGSWSGMGLDLSADFEVLATFDVTLTVNGSDGSYTGSGPEGAFAGTLSLANGSYGAFTGTQSDTMAIMEAVTQYVYVTMSQDHQAIGLVVCDSTEPASVADCGYGGLSRQ